VYIIERKDSRIIVRQDDQPKFSAPEDSYIIYNSPAGQKCAKLKDLPDDQLLLAIANKIEL